LSTEHTITISVDEMEGSALMTSSVAVLTRQDRSKRFRSYEGINAAATFRDPAFANGTMYWTACRLEALMLVKVLRAEGFQAHLLWDQHYKDHWVGNGHVALTTRPFEEAHPHDETEGDDL
jgi:hypothetical protein